MSTWAADRLNTCNFAGPAAAVAAGRDGWRQLMRHVILQFWLSLDGYSCDEDTELYRLMEEAEDPEQQEYFVGRLRQAGTHIMGRVTYEEMAKFWPTSDHPIAAPMNDIPKVVFSASLQSATWSRPRRSRPASSSCATSQPATGRNVQDPEHGCTTSPRDRP